MHRLHLVLATLAVVIVGHIGLVLHHTSQTPTTSAVVDVPFTTPTLSGAEEEANTIHEARGSFDAGEEIQAPETIPDRVPPSVQAEHALTMAEPEKPAVESTQPAGAAEVVQARASSATVTSVVPEARVVELAPQVVKAPAQVARALGLLPISENKSKTDNGPKERPDISGLRSQQAEVEFVRRASYRRKNDLKIKNDPAEIDPYEHLADEYLQPYGQPNSTAVAVWSAKFKGEKGMHMVHVPKCGGTSMTKILRRMACVLNGGTAQSYDCCHRPGFCGVPEQRTCKAIRGCTMHFPNLRFAKIHMTPSITVLREPLPRVLSAWLYRCHLCMPQN